MKEGQETDSKNSQQKPSARRRAPRDAPDPTSEPVRAIVLLDGGTSAADFLPIESLLLHCGADERHDGHGGGNERGHDVWWDAGGEVRRRVEALEDVGVGFLEGEVEEGEDG